MSEELKKLDISAELWREYDWDGRIYRIDNPVTLYIRPGGTTHRVVDASGVAHCIPSVGEHGCVLRWKNRSGIEPVQF